MMRRYLLLSFFIAGILTQEDSEFFHAILQLDQFRTNETIAVDAGMYQVLAPRKGETWETLTNHTIAVNWNRLRHTGVTMAYVYLAQVIEGDSVYHIKNSASLSIGDADPATYPEAFPYGAPAGSYVLIARPGISETFGDLDQKAIFGMSDVFVLNQDTDPITLSTTSIATTSLPPKSSTPHPSVPADSNKTTSTDLSSSPSSTAGSSPAAPSNPGSATVIGSAVGGALGGIIVILGAALILVLRQRRARTKGRTPPEDIYHKPELDASSPQADLSTEDKNEQPQELSPDTGLHEMDNGHDLIHELPASHEHASVP
jgi:hypothetical protein